MVIITHLDPPVELAVSALTLRLNNDLIDEFKRCLSAGIKPKLVVKDGLMVSSPCGECASTGPEVAATDAGGAARVCHFGRHRLVRRVSPFLARTGIEVTSPDPMHVMCSTNL